MAEKIITVQFPVTDDLPASYQAFAGRTVRGKLICRDMGAENGNRKAVDPNWETLPDGFKIGRSGGHYQPKGGTAGGASGQAAETAQIAFAREMGSWSDAHDMARLKFPGMPIADFVKLSRDEKTDVGAAVAKYAAALDVAE